MPKPGGVLVARDPWVFFFWGGWYLFSQLPFFVTNGKKLIEFPEP